jgi:RHS repeat-associated protein
VGRAAGGVQTDYVYWGNSLLYETTSGRATDYVWAEGKLLAKVETTGTTYFHHDHLGSSKLQTDDSGNVVSSDVTQPFGPRICADAVKDEFTTLDRVNTVASTIAFDATNGVVKAPHGANGYQTGELYTTELQPGVDARVVKLGWTGSGVTFYVSTDGNTWSQLQKDQPLSLGTSTRSLYLKAVLAADASSVLDRYLLQINPTGFNLFTGKMLTEETGLVYFGARWYDPEIGRWITPDPAEDGENWYSYCGNNPVNYKDPNGEYALADDVLLFAGGGLIAAGIEAGFQAWQGKFDPTSLFTAFMKGGIAAWLFEYLGPAAIPIYAFMDSLEVQTRAALEGKGYSLNTFIDRFTGDMIVGLTANVLGNTMGKLANKLTPCVSSITNKLKSKFSRNNGLAKLDLQFFASEIPTSRSWGNSGKPIETIYNGQKIRLRVDLEVDSNKIQIQAGHGKDSIVDIRIDPSLPIEGQIPKKLNLSSGQKQILIKWINEAIKCLRGRG